MEPVDLIHCNIVWQLGYLLKVQTWVLVFYASDLTWMGCLPATPCGTGFLFSGPLVDGLDDSRGNI